MDGTSKSRDEAEFSKDAHGIREDREGVTGCHPFFIVAVYFLTARMIALIKKPTKNSNDHSDIAKPQNVQCT